MKPKEPQETGQLDAFRSRLDQIIDMGHEKVVLANKIDWQFLCDRCGGNYSDKPGHPALSTRLMAGLHILKYADNLSDEEVCARWVENPYYQFFCGEEFFSHTLPLDRSSMTRWRQRMGEDAIEALLQESLSVAVKVGAAKPADFTKVIVDTTVMEKNIAYPTDAKLIRRAQVNLVKQAKAEGLKLRQSYKRVGKLALIKQQRYAHAKQFKRSRRELKRLKTWLGRTMRDIKRQIAGDEALSERFKSQLDQAKRVMSQKPRDGGQHIYALHAPEVDCLGKGKAHKPWEFGVKASIATTMNRCKGGQFAIHAKALPGRPYDGHTLETILPDIERMTGAALKRILADDGYRGHNASMKHRLKVFTTSQKRRVTPQIKRERKRRSAVEPVIGHLKSGHRMGRNFLAHKQGDAINPILAAAGYNFRLILKWIRLLGLQIWILIIAYQSTIYT